MTELAISPVPKAGSVEVSPSPSPRKPKIREKKFSKIIRTLYTAIIHRKGIYAHVSMETHAPQLKYYPGSPALKRAVKKAKQHHESLAGMGLPSTDEVQSMIDQHTQEVFSGNGEKLEILGEEFDISAVKITKEQGEHLKKLQLLFRAAEEYEKEAAEIYVPTKVLKRWTLEHRRWLWFATLTDRREKSDFVYPAHCRIYEDYPELYSAEAVNISPDQFREMIRKKRYKIGSPYQSAEFWLICAKTLFQEFDGDPVNLLKAAGWSVDKVYAWKQKQKKERGYDPIPGWGRKLISLYFLYLAELGYPLPDDAFPADVHAQAILIQTGCLDFGDRDVLYTSAVAEMIRKEATDNCREKGHDVVIYGNSSYLLGSQLCTNCAGNETVPHLCPIYKECKGRVDTSSYFARGIWRKGGQVMTKGGIRPQYGLPTNVMARERSRKKGQTKREMANIIPLFPT